MKSSMSRIGLIFFLALLSLAMTVAAAFAKTNGSIKTTNIDCGTPVNANAYSNGDTIYIYGDGFDPANLADTTWDIVPVNSDCDTDGVAIISGDFHLSGSTCTAENADGGCVAGGSHQFCFEAYIVGTAGTIDPDCGIYKARVDSKTDNYNVAALSPSPTPSPTPGQPSLTITKTGHAEGNNLVFTVTVHNAGDTETSDPGAYVVDTWGSDLAYDSYSGSNWSCTPNGDTELDCIYGATIGAGNNAVLTITLTPDPLPATRTCYTNYASTSLTAETDSGLITLLGTPAPYDDAMVCIGGPTPAVPTMTEWGMILFVFLAGMASIFYLRRRKRA